MNWARGRLGAIALLCGGCSVLTMETLPSNHAQLVSFRCTSNNVAPGLDLLDGLGLSVAAGLAFSQAGESQGTDGDPGLNSGTATALGAVATVAAVSFLGSSIYGFQTTAKCRAALDDAALRANRAAGALDSATGAYVPRRPGFSEGLANKPGATPEDATLQVSVGTSYIRAMLYGQPKRFDRIRLTVGRQSPVPTLDKCDRVELTLDAKTEQLAGAPSYKTGTTQDGLTWEMLTVELPRTQANAIATASSARIAACGNALALTPQQVTLVARFLSGWDAMAKQPATPATAPATTPVTPVPAPTEDAGAPGAAPEPTLGCHTDIECKGDRICNDGKCQDPR